VHDPGKNRDVVRGNNETIHDDGETDTLGALINAIKGDDDAATVGLADADLEAENGNTEEKEGNEVWDEPLEAVVGKDDRGITKEVTESDSAALGARLVMVLYEIAGGTKAGVPWQRAQRPHVKATYHGHRLPFLHLARERRRLS
jgi:hypothetical protein